MPQLVPRDRVAHETLDGEVLILDEVTGLYYSLTGAGADVWLLLQDGVDTEELAGALLARYDVDGARARTAVDGLVAELCREGLLEPLAGAAGSTPPLAGERRPWAEPALEKFTELKTLLLLDPVHHVDDSGWPRAKPKLT